MEKDLFSYKSYKKYLVDVLGGAKKRTGKRLALAKALNVQTAYISQVLNGSAHLSVEQGLLAADYFGHTPEEKDFFLLLLQIGRAGTVELKEYFKGQIDKIIQKRLVIKNRLKDTQQISKEDQVKYYSRWYYLAIHMAVSVPHLQNKESLLEFFKLPLEKVSEATEFLLNTGLIEQKNGRYRVGDVHIHLANDSENILKHHSNWRLQALKKVDDYDPKNLHYSVVYSVSKKDAQKIKDEIIKLIQSNLKIVAPSKEETLYCNTIDFFELNS